MRRTLPTLAALLLLAGSARAEGNPGHDFFEAKIRPVLAEHCLSCHGPKRQQAGLRLDSRAALLKGGEDGPVVRLDRPGESALLKALRHQGDVKMPPKGKLPPQVVEDVAAWLKMGAPWPEGKVAAATPAEDPSRHWAFQPVKKPAVPAVRQPHLVQTPVDAFHLAALDAKGLPPAPLADRRTLLRRVSYDLIGLPPTAEEVTAFEADRSPDAFAKVVDRLLASPRYGERWGRHWLDVARYADTRGYVFTEERKFPNSYTYRDYVIRAFNEDLPYDQFVLQQLAADRLPLGEDKRPLAAMGYLTLGRRFLNNVHDIIDDRIDVVTRGLLGLTVSCARCHDHKFDPIPSKDYYSLYGVFASSVEPKELPLIGAPADTPEYQKFLTEIKAREQKLTDFERATLAEMQKRWREHVGDILLAVKKAGNKPIDPRQFQLVAGEIHPAMVKRWQGYLKQQEKNPSPVWVAWFSYASIPDAEFAQRAAAVKLDAAKVHPLIAEELKREPPKSLNDVAAGYSRVFAALANPQASLDAKEGEQELRKILIDAQSPLHVEAKDARKFFDRAARDKQRALQQQIDAFRANSPAAPPRAMVLVDAPTPQEPHVFLRGNPGNPGPAVPRQFLEILAGKDRKPFTQGSGRLELARAIASKDNPLTARVLVNRLWLHHFGAGLIRTPSDFGLRSEPPTHPALLDYLASRFVEDGWSIKKMHKLILLSRVYQQASDDTPEGLKADLENRLLWKMNRRRLDFEAMRDTLLAVSGQLDLKTGGPSVDLLQAPFSGRRTVYGFIDRQNLPGLFRTFDLASPDSSSPQRHQTTVPQQALFLMNSPFAQEQAKALLRLPEISSRHEPEDKIRQLYRRVLDRPAERDEVTLALRYLDEAGAPAEAAWQRYAQVLLMTNELMFVD
jgi:hypothetical protein